MYAQVGSGGAATTPACSTMSPAMTEGIQSPSSTQGHDGKTASSPTQAGLPVRSSCNYCRGKKIKCDKTRPEEGGCARCRREGIACCYETRDPIGRPRKRKASSSEATPLPETSSQITSNEARGASSCCGSKDMVHSRDRSDMATPVATTSAVRLSGYAPEEHYGYWPQMPRFASPTVSPSMSGFASSSMATPSSMTSVDTVKRANVSGNDLSALPPNLSDLGLAAFLESLDTLEIAPEDGLTPSMLKSIGDVSSASGSVGIQAQAAGPAASSALSFANIGATSYAVPSDMSWSDPAWLSSLAQMQSQSQMPAPWNPEASRPTTAKGNTVLPNDTSLGMHFGNTRQEEMPKAKAECCCTPGAKSMASASTSTSNADRTSVGVGSDLIVDDKPVQRATPHLDEQTRVHCVPNPSGKGCTCLCDVSVALINVRTTLRQARDEESQRGADYGDQAVGRRAASTLQLTLSASQAVAAQCACSASCPTCRSDPSTSLSASLLVSTALQIYIRAVRTLRQGLGAGEASGVGSTSHAGSIAGAGSIWDVSIGQYRPKAANAKRIALFAMKLELRDLRDSIAKISRAACPGAEIRGEGTRRHGKHGRHTSIDFDAGSDGFTSTDSGLAMLDGSTSSGINPIDQVVIRKLHQQLGDLLRTVESIEEQQDAERAAMTLSDA